MSKDTFLNPINKDKVAENPGLLPYAHTAGGAVIRPEDMGKSKGRSITAMRQQTDRQMNQLYEQMEVLASLGRTRCWHDGRRNSAYSRAFSHIKR